MKADLNNLSAFGEVSAEDDAVLEYFLATNEVEAIRTRKKFLVLGRKGSGKTAIVRYFTEKADDGSYSRKLNLRGYPWTVHSSRRDNGATEMESYVASWRYLIAVEISSLVIGRISDSHTEQGASLRTCVRSTH